VARAIFAFNGDLESRLALHWLVHEYGYAVTALSINLGQGDTLQPLGEVALELGAEGAQVVDCQDLFLRRFALPLLQADAVYEGSCYLGSALARYVIAQELVRVAEEEGCSTVAHGAASKGNDQVRMETAIAALKPDLKVLAVVRQWHLRTLPDKIAYARRHHLPIDEPTQEAVTVDRNLWGVNVYLHEVGDPWTSPPADAFVLTRSPEQAPDQTAELILGFDQGVPVSLNGATFDLVPLVRRLNEIGGTHGVGRCDMVEDRLFGIKSREYYEAPAAALLHLAHRELEALVLSRELRQFKNLLSQRYAELTYAGLWFHELRQALDGFFAPTQSWVSGEVRLHLYKGLAAVAGRRSPYSLYDSRLANQANLDMFENNWAQGFTTLMALPARLAARRELQRREGAS
jgi:argininosuccinate synthase